MILHIRSKYTAVGRKEIIMLFYMYLVISLLAMFLDSGIIPTANAAYPVRCLTLSISSVSLLLVVCRHLHRPNRIRVLLSSYKRICRLSICWGRHTIVPLASSHMLLCCLGHWFLCRHRHFQAICFVFLLEPYCSLDRISYLADSLRRCLYRVSTHSGISYSGRSVAHRWHCFWRSVSKKLIRQNSLNTWHFQILGHRHGAPVRFQWHYMQRYWTLPWRPLFPRALCTIGHNDGLQVLG